MDQRNEMKLTKEKKIVVTGGAGFIGSHLTDQLLSDGHFVKVFDNFSTGRWENLAKNCNNPHLQTHEIDISVDPLDEYLDDVDWVFHIAGLADVFPSLQEPSKYFQANVVGTEKILEASRNSCIQRFVYVASSSCYGIPETFPTPEVTKIRPEHPYALTKYIGEQLVTHWAEVYGLPTVCLRLFNVFGPRSRTSGAYSSVFDVFLAQKLAGRPFTVVGDGRQTRDFVFIQDVVYALIKAATSDLKGVAMNVGSGKTYSINHLVELLEGEVVFIPKRPKEPSCTLADISLIKRKLNWEPKISFQDGVSIMLDNIECWQEATVWTKDSIDAVTSTWFKNLS